MCDETRPQASVIIVNYNGLGDLKACLRSLEADSNDWYDVIVVDNDSTDGSAVYVRENHPQVEVVENGGNLGFGHGSNVGARRARGAYLAFLNPDTVVEPGWLDALVVALKDHPGAALATSKIVLRDDPERINTCGNRVHCTGLTLCRGLGARRGNFGERAWVSAVSGAAFVARRDLFETLGGFDETFFLYMEDTDLSWRAQLAGYGCLYVPDSVVHHDYILRFGPRKTYYQERNRYVMLLKSLRWGTLLLLLPALLLGEVVTWGFVLLRERRCAMNKLRAYAWVAEHWDGIMEARRGTQTLRRVSDRELIGCCTHRLAFEQTGDGLIPRIAHWVFDPPFLLLQRLALRLMPGKARVGTSALSGRPAVHKPERSCRSSGVSGARAVAEDSTYVGHQHRVALRFPPQVDGEEARLSDLPGMWATSLGQTARRHLQTPLYVNAYCLIANTALNSLLGLVFWTAAARLYATEEVGIASAAISAMTLLAGLSSLGLDVGLVRFLPGAHRMSATMLDSTFTLVSVSSLVCAAVFLVGLPFWSPALTFAYEQPGFLATFGLLAVVTALGKVADGAFISHRAARFTLLRQGILNAVKIPMLLVFLVVGGAFGIITSLAVATTVALGVALIFCLPAVERAYSPRIRLSKKIIVDILPYAVGNHLANFLVQSPQVVLPLVILNVLGPADSAYFYVTWMTANLLFAVPRSIATSMVAEGANEEDALRGNAKRALGMVFVLLVPAVILALIAGDKLLLIFGREYAGRGADLLRILAVSAVPVGVNHVYFAINRVKKKTGCNLVAGCLVAGVTLGLACALMTQYGTVATGIGWLAGQGALSVLVVASLCRYGR